MKMTSKAGWAWKVWVVDRDGKDVACFFHGPFALTKAQLLDAAEDSRAWVAWVGEDVARGKALAALRRGVNFPGGLKIYGRAVRATLSEHGHDDAAAFACVHADWLEENGFCRPSAALRAAFAGAGGP